MTTRKSQDRIIIALLVVAAIVELVLLLAHSGVINFSGKSQVSDGQRAGIIERTHNSLRRRSLNSLVWENSTKDEVVHFYDSVLTLKESTALLKLDNNTEVELSENTLITIDPPSAAHDGEIRLRFVRGNMSARNPYASSKVGGDQWTVDLKAGANVQLREVGEGVEVQLHGGDATIKTADGVENLDAGQVLRVNGSEVSRLNVDQNLKWEEPRENSKPHRIYVHGESTAVPLQWQGSVTQVSIQTLGKGEQAVEVKDSVKATIVELPVGEHRLYLRNGNTTSKPLDVQVWHAPVLHLLSPLPRNRVHVDEKVTFVWQRPQGIPNFEIKMVAQDGELLKKSIDQNTFTFYFGKEADVSWFVQGIDSDGFMFPPLYRYPLYIRNKPLPAPKLKMPELRAPASEKKAPGPGAWLWNLIVPQVQAEETKFEAVFSWEPVEKADQYTIEISDSPDFRNPVVNATISETEFTWRGFLFQKYHWRVAAGSSKGQMGLFTLPVTVDFEPLKSNGKIVALDGILIRKIQTAVESVLPTAAAPPAVVEGPAVIAERKAIPHDEAKIPFKKRINLTRTQEEWRPIILWQPNYSYMDVKGNEDSAATLTGGSGMAFGIEYPWRDYRNALWLFDIAINHYIFTPDPKEKFPFQDDLQWLEADVAATRYTSSLGMGVKIRQILSLIRKDYEEVEADTTLWFGPEVAGNFPLPIGEFNLKGSALFSRDGQGVNLQPEWRCRIGDRFVTGFGADGMWMYKSPNASLILRTYVTVGFPF